jgi:WD40 repeat protein
MVFSRDDRFIISGGLYDSMKIWNSRTLRVIYELEVRVKNMCLSGNNRNLAAIEYGNGILIFDLLTQKVSKIPTKPGRTNTCIAFSPDSSKIISGSYFGIVEVWNTTSLVLERSFKAQLYRINSISMSRDGKVLVCSGTKRVVKVWNMESNSLQGIVKGSLHRMYENWMSNRKFIVTAGRNKTLGVWEIK